MCDTECSVCCETFDKRAHTPVKCPKCDFAACKKCTQTYIISQTKDPHCMSCSVGFTTDFMYANLNKTFVNVTLKEEQLKRLIELEKARLPESMNDVAAMNELQSPERIKETDQLKKDRLVALKELERVRAVVDGLNHRINENQRMLENAEEIIFKHKKKVDNHFKFIQPCPVKDCKGYLSKSWKCELCSTWACSKCLEVVGPTKDTPHECKKENLESAEEIRKSTKPCPDCGTRIYKISGCPQMWCTQCKIAFNWNTGKRENGIIHNPHYFEFRRAGGLIGAQPRNPGDVVCGGVPRDFYRILQILASREGLALRKHLENLERAVGHNGHILTRMRQSVNEAVDHRYLRYQYLTKKVDDAQFRRKISTANTRRRKTQTQLDILEIFQTVLIENMNEMMNIHRPKTAKDGEKSVAIYGSVYGVNRGSSDIRARAKYEDYKRFMDELRGLFNNCLKIKDYVRDQFRTFRKNTNLTSLDFSKEMNPNPFILN